jgi:hypothetical protein
MARSPEGATIASCIIFQSRNLIIVIAIAGLVFGRE